MAPADEGRWPAAHGARTQRGWTRNRPPRNSRLQSSHRPAVEQARLDLNPIVRFGFGIPARSGVLRGAGLPEILCGCDGQRVLRISRRPPGPCLEAEGFELRGSRSPLFVWALALPFPGLALAGASARNCEPKDGSVEAPLEQQLQQRRPQHFGSAASYIALPQPPQSARSSLVSLALRVPWLRWPLPSARSSLVSLALRVPWLRWPSPSRSEGKASLAPQQRENTLESFDAAASSQAADSWPRNSPKKDARQVPPPKRATLADAFLVEAQGSLVPTIRGDNADVESEHSRAPRPPSYKASNNTGAVRAPLKTPEPQSANGELYALFGGDGSGGHRPSRGCGVGAGSSAALTRASLSLRDAAPAVRPVSAPGTEGQFALSAIADRRKPSLDASPRQTTLPHARGCLVPGHTHQALAHARVLVASRCSGAQGVRRDP
eukprot:CAMPEP_0117517594 /NCGR_PEP_ID=MMETSP0784-20121206/31691_1 /TAXON_ID=39447 /ORGANISM="" /LENGTH=435 /DNA_ID=CAMNT_0005313477 /DNA_START=51 /DNA_END=1363 /DNA_ORIENTATION=-